LLKVVQLINGYILPAFIIKLHIKDFKILEKNKNFNIKSNKFIIKSFNYSIFLLKLAGNVLNLVIFKLYSLKILTENLFMIV